MHFTVVSGLDALCVLSVTSFVLNIFLLTVQCAGVNFVLSTLLIEYDH